MSKFVIFIGLSIVAYWLIIGDIDFYKIATGILFVLLGVFKEMTDFWKYEAMRHRIISTQMIMDINKLYGEGAADKLRSLATANTLKHLKELEESGKKIPDVICKELEKLKLALEKETTTKK